MLAELLGGGQTSVLTRSCNSSSRVAVYTDAYYDDTSLDDTSFSLVVVPAAGVSASKRPRRRWTRCWPVLIETGVDPAQLDRIKFQVKASQIYGLDNPGSLARRYGNALTTGLTVEDVQAWPDVLQAVTGEDIMAAAKKVLDRRKSVTGYLMGPEDEARLQQEVTQ